MEISGKTAIVTGLASGISPTKMVIGKLPSDPRFHQEWMTFLDQLGALLAAANADG